MESYPLRLQEGYLLIDDNLGSTLLVDTGSPLSFQKEGRILLGGKIITVGESMPLVDVSPEYLTEKLHTPVDGILGMDILGKFPLEINVPLLRMVIHDGCPEGWEKVPSYVNGMYAVLKMDIQGREADVILDTGAPISYLVPSFTEGLTPVGSRTDFWPMNVPDTFETPIFRMDALLDGKSFSLEAGNLPGRGSLMLSMMGIQGVVGKDILEQTPILIHDGALWTKSFISVDSSVIPDAELSEEDKKVAKVLSENGILTVEDRSRYSSYSVSNKGCSEGNPIVISETDDYVHLEYLILDYLMNFPYRVVDYKVISQRLMNTGGRFMDVLTLEVSESEPDFLWEDKDSAATEKAHWTEDYFFDITAGFKSIL